MHRHTSTLQYLAQFPRIFSNQDYFTGKLLNGYTQWREVLSFAVATQDQNDFAICSHAIDSGHSGTYIRSLAVVDVFHVLYNSHRCHTVWFTTVFAQGVQHSSQGCTRCSGQSQRRHSIERVMATTNT